VEGVAEAILPDGSLQVEGVRIGAGEVALVSPLRTGESDP
ncbi:bifunctional biotin--[acetyl-CoA-carboxylase] synthetase/biotin operon repressor, partial [Thermus scotoductus]